MFDLHNERQIIEHERVGGYSRGGQHGFDLRSTRQSEPPHSLPAPENPIIVP